MDLGILLCAKLWFADHGGRGKGGGDVKAEPQPFETCYSERSEGHRDCLVDIVEKSKFLVSLRESRTKWLNKSLGMDFMVNSGRNHSGKILMPIRTFPGHPGHPSP